MDCIKSMHPKFESYSRERKYKAYDDLAASHPALLAEQGKWRNKAHLVPNYPTSSRLMEPEEQKFLTDAMQLLKEDMEERPFRIHGESGAVGNRDGEVREFRHSPKDAVALTNRKGDKYALHSHPPFSEPFTSSASEGDHKAAAATYLGFNNEMKEYVTNGKDVLHIPATNLGLIKLHPDPKVEETLGKFPVAFTVPEPQTPPRPFANHEAPAAFKKDWEPPAGWTPPQDYPRGQSAG
jgi:hypothetical protein